MLFAKINAQQSGVDAAPGHTLDARVGSAAAKQQPEEEALEPVVLPQVTGEGI
jgi:hypothetical protein